MPMLSTGLVLQSQTGRTLSPAPRIDTTTDQRIRCTIKRIDIWLLKEATVECRANPSKWMPILPGSYTPGRFSDGDRSCLNTILFDD